MASFVRGLKSKAFDVKSSLANRHAHDNNDFRKASLAELFKKTSADVDGEDCLHDCETCTIKYPRKFSIEEGDELYGHINAWSTHLLVATGKTDWVRDVSDEKGSVMEAVNDSPVQPSNGKMMLSACNIPLPNHATSHSEGTTVLLLPLFTFVDNVRPTTVSDLISELVNNAPTNTSPLAKASNSSTTPSETSNSTAIEAALPPPSSLPHNMVTRSCGHKAIILLCSQATRDARCGQSAPLLRKEFERHLRPLGLARDLDDDRPGGVGIYFISHVGGHKYSANVMVYRRSEVNGEAAQCIWLARVRPEDCENIVRYTVGEGKVVKPERQLRGGFDRDRGLTSW